MEINRSKYTHKEMTEELKQILDKNIVSEVKVNLPKLKKVKKNPSKIKKINKIVKFI